MKEHSHTFIVLVLLFSLLWFKLSSGATIEEVHSWPDSQCTLCHLSSAPDPATPLLIAEDRSRLCESCHSGSLTAPDHFSTSFLPVILKNHPIKISPLDFDAERINQNIIQRGAEFYISGPGGEVRLFGTSLETAVTECTTCHDPHGKSGLPGLQYTDNPADDLCLICHLLKNTLTKRS